MTIVITEERVVQLVTEVLRTSYEIKDDSYEFTPRYFDGSRKLRLQRDRIAEIVQNVLKKQECNETILFDGKFYEVPISDEGRSRLFMLRPRQSPVVKEDVENSITYKLSLPTDEYTLFFLNKLNSGGTRLSRVSMIDRFRLRRGSEENDFGEDLFLAIKYVLPRLYTLQIESKKNRTLEEMTRLSAAFLFQFTFNLDTPLFEVRYLDDYVRSGRITRTRTSEISDIEAPKRLYIPDLIYHYQMGVATDSPLLEYLSYYHVAEHFFDEVYNDDLIESVRDRITRPEFSYRRKKDIQDLIKEINRRVKNRNDTVIFSEQEALRLTIQKFVDHDELRTNISNYDNSLIAYYSNNAVLFSEGDTCDLENTDHLKLFLSLSRRIYKTRNAIVHSKDGEKSRYVPFEHDKILAKEIPLLRFIAEAIIVKTSKLM